MFDIIAPNGEVLFQNIGYFLDDLDEPGVYTVRVYLIQERENDARLRLRLRLPFLYMSRYSDLF